MLRRKSQKRSPYIRQRHGGSTWDAVSCMVPTKQDLPHFLDTAEAIAELMLSSIPLMSQSCLSWTLVHLAASHDPKLDTCLKGIQEDPEGFQEDSTYDGLSKAGDTRLWTRVFSTGFALSPGWQCIARARRPEADRPICPRQFWQLLRQWLQFSVASLGDSRAAHGLDRQLHMHHASLEPLFFS